MRTVGFYRELSSKPMKVFDVSIRDALRSVPGDYEQEIVAYLDQGIPLVDVMESTLDVISKSGYISGGSSILSDGIWVWRQDLSHYVRNYHLELDSEFVQHALLSGFTISDPGRDQLLALADTALREVLDMS